MHFCYFTKEYDARGNCTKFSYFDDKDKPAMTSQGASTVCYEYDDNGNETARYFLDTEAARAYSTISAHAWNTSTTAGQLHIRKAQEHRRKTDVGVGCGIL